MKEKTRNSIRAIDFKLGLLERFLKEGRLKEALAEIRDVEVTQDVELGSVDAGHFWYYSAEVFRKLGDYETALSKARNAFEVLRETAENRRIAEIKYSLGNIHVALGDLGTAEQELCDSLATYKRINDDRGRISVLCMLANIHFQQSNYRGAMHHLLDSIRLCDKIGNHSVKARGLSNLSRIYTVLARWRLAEDSLREAIKVFEKEASQLYLCRALLSLGYICCLQRYFQKAKKYYERALKLIYTNNYARELAIYHEYSGELAFAQRDYSLAKEHYSKAIEIGDKIAPEGDIISQTYRLLAEVQIAEKEYDQALCSCDRAMKVAASLGEKIEIGAIHRALGQIHTARREKEKAKENFEKSVSILEQIGAKFELGKAHLEAVKSHSLEYVERVAHYARGKEIFRELESDYHVAMITFAFCEFLCERGEYEKAEVHLTDSEKILKRLGEKRDLDSVSELRSRLDRALGKIGAPGAKHRTEYHFSDVITKDPQMLALIEEAGKIKDADVSILLEGETGTGKDLLAKVIHCESKRKDKQFVKVNCAAIPDNLLESELFGYKKGAFSGADKDKRGLMEEADGGTIFLNEIGDLPLRLQAKMLDVIEDKEITRLGEVTPRKIDFRVMVATNKNLNQEVGQGGFRKDLYHRLNVVTLRLPPLRDRRSDIPLLIVHFLAELGVNGITPADLENSSSIQGCMLRDWSGNVRELKNELKRLVSILNPLDAERLLEELSRPGPVESPGDCLSDKKAELERAEIVETIMRCCGNREEAAKELGISKATLYRRIRQYNLEL